MIKRWLLRLAICLRRIIAQADPSLIEEGVDTPMIIEEPGKRQNRASLIVAIRYIHPSQTQKATST